MAKRPGRKRDIWFQRSRPFGYTPVSVEGLILTFVVGPIGILFLVWPDWLTKQGFDPWVGAASFASGVVVMLVCFVLCVTHCGFDPDL